MEGKGLYSKYTTFKMNYSSLFVTAIFLYFIMFEGFESFYYVQNAEVPQLALKSREELFSQRCIYCAVPTRLRKIKRKNLCVCDN